MSNATQTVRIKADQLNQEATQQLVLEKLCDLVQSENGWFEGNQTTATQGSEVSVFNSTAVPGGSDRWLNKIIVSCNRAGKFRILKGATQIGSGRTSPSERNVIFPFTPGYKLIATETVEVKFEQFSGTNSPVEVYAQGTET